MNVVSKVEAIVKRIESDLGAKYIGADGSDAKGRPYIDAADFILELSDRSRTRFNISGLDCIQRGDDETLEDLIRHKARVAMRNTANH
jgi:hypothetical protein